MSSHPRRSHHSTYRSAWWVPGPHAQTLWGKLVRRAPVTVTRPERWHTPDNDFLDLHRLDPPSGAPAETPHVILLHGLEGTRRSHYVQGLFAECARRGWSADLVLWRSCGEEMNRARRFYHSGETTDLAFVVDRVTRERPLAPLGLVGVSLGGNVLLKYLGERQEEPSVRKRIAAAVAISVPFDLAKGAEYISRGFSRIYERHFLRTLTRKVVLKLAQYPDLITPERLLRLRTLVEFDDALTAPIHGFANARDYYTRSSAIRFLEHISIKTLLLSAIDDPFLPSPVLDAVRDIVARTPELQHTLQLEFHARGGHAGFVGGRVPWRPDYYLERRTGEFLATEFERAGARVVVPSSG